VTTSPSSIPQDPGREKISGKWPPIFRAASITFFYGTLPDGDRSTGAKRSSNTILIGGTICCFMNIFMETTGPDWGPAIKRDGPPLSPNCWNNRGNDLMPAADKATRRTDASPITQPAPLVDFGREICGDLRMAARREWLVTNGIGGFASGTVAGSLTRRYHGLLIAALHPPLGRTLLVSKLEETVEYDGSIVQLSTNHWHGGAVAPTGVDLFGTVSGWRARCLSGPLLSRMPGWRNASGWNRAKTPPMCNTPFPAAQCRPGCTFAPSSMTGIITEQRRRGGLNFPSLLFPMDCAFTLKADLRFF
jgi:hypothetical protein